MKTRKVADMRAASRRFRQRVLQMLRDREAAHDLRSGWSSDEVSRILSKATREIIRAIEAMR